MIIQGDTIKSSATGGAPNVVDLVTGKISEVVGKEQLNRITGNLEEVPIDPGVEARSQVLVHKNDVDAPIVDMWNTFATLLGTGFSYQGTSVKLIDWTTKQMDVNDEFDLTSDGFVSSKAGLVYNVTLSVQAKNLDAGELPLANLNAYLNIYTRIYDNNGSLVSGSHKMANSSPIGIGADGLVEVKMQYQTGMILQGYKLVALAIIYDNSTGALVKGQIMGDKTKTFFQIIEA